MSADKPSGSRHVLFIHGWNAGGGSLGAWHGRLRAEADEDWTFWKIECPLHRWGFDRAAAEISAALRATGREFEDVLLFGFSMGGVVARQIVADGFFCRALVAVGSPHQGIARWVPTHSPGTSSIHWRSQQLSALNAHPVDRAARAHYHFYSLTYRDHFGAHPHDGLIPRRSALGLSLGPVATRVNTEFRYQFPPGTGPHLRGLEPDWVPEARDKMLELLA